MSSKLLKLASLLSIASIACGGDEGRCSLDGYCDPACMPDPDCAPDAGTSRMFADMQWQLRCPSDAVGCVDGPNQDVFAVDGEDGATLSCSLEEAVTGDRTVRLEALQSRVRLAVTNLRAARSGGPAASDSGCVVAIEEDGTTFLGACGPAAPSPEQPCQVSELMFVEERIGDTDIGRFGPEVVFRLLCDGLRASEPAAGTRDLRNSRTSAAPARVRMINCPGF